MKHYMKLSYKETAMQLNQIHEWFDKKPYGKDYDMRLNKFLGVDDLTTHLDILKTCILNHFFLCGTREHEMSSGMQNSMIIQCGLLNVCGSDLGIVPEWNMNDHETTLMLDRIRHAEFVEDPRSTEHQVPIKDLI